MTGRFRCYTGCPHSEQNTESGSSSAPQCGQRGAAEAGAGVDAMTGAVTGVSYSGAGSSNEAAGRNALPPEGAELETVTGSGVYAGEA